MPLAVAVLFFCVPKGRSLEVIGQFTEGDKETQIQARSPSSSQTILFCFVQLFSLCSNGLMFFWTKCIVYLFLAWGSFYLCYTSCLCIFCSWFAFLFVVYFCSTFSVKFGVKLSLVGCWLLTNLFQYVCILNQMSPLDSTVDMKHDECMGNVQKCLESCLAFLWTKIHLGSLKQ